MAEIRKGTIEELQFDPQNANKGKPKGRAMLTESVQRNGLGRSVFCDRNLTILGGNKTTEIAGETEVAQEVVFVHTTGETLVAVVRDDVDLSAEPGSEEYRKAAELAIADNGVSAANLDWDEEVLEMYRDQGIEVALYVPEAAGNELPPPGDAAERPLDQSFSIVIECRDEEHQVELLDRFQAEGILCRAVLS